MTSPQANCHSEVQIGEVSSGKLGNLRGLSALRTTIAQVQSPFEPVAESASGTGAPDTNGAADRRKHGTEADEPGRGIVADWRVTLPTRSGICRYLKLNRSVPQDYG